MAVLCRWGLLVGCIFFIHTSYQTVDAVETKACKASNYGSLILPCSVNNTRSIVPFMKTACDTTKAGSYFPKIINNLPCQCPPGKGIVISTSPSFSWKCVTCKPGNFSVGGSVIDTWERWNGSLNVPGSGYKFTLYCVRVVKGGSCQGWRPSNDFTHLMSSPFINATERKTCLEEKSMQTYMKFYSNEADGNYITFQYKVDGMPCPKGRAECFKGLSFYVDEKRVLKVDVQFSWAVFKLNLTKGIHIFRWSHLSTCSSDAGWFDVAYVTHVTFVGVKTAHTVCNPCPVGTYSNKQGSSECIKCPYGKYQDKPGQTKCLECPEKSFSHIGDKSCFELKQCRESDYIHVPDPIEKCYMGGDRKVIRKAHTFVPSWPGMKKGPCISGLRPLMIVNCTCPSGSKLTLVHKTDGKDTYVCQSCPRGQVIDGTGKCGPCPAGKAAIPGIFIKEWAMGPVSKLFRTECSGDNCNGVGWVNAGDSIATKRIPGNFETFLELKDLDISYYRSYIRFSCSIDCRINPSTNNFARNDDCFLRFSLTRGNGTTVRDVDCIRYGRHHQRNGTKMNHYYLISKPGRYTMRWTFHQNDDERTNVLSYEAKVYSVVILGVVGGPAKECIKCARGSQVSADGTSCEKCGVGTYSEDGQKCIPCPEGYFTDKNQSSKCIQCGANTTSNKERTDCVINDCKFYAAPGILYDLMPMANVGGPMIEVKQHRKEGYHMWYRNYFYVNLCTRDHDNSSCTDLRQKSNERGKFVRETVVLKTMACKRWSFSSRYSYSIGRVMGFKPKENVASGVTVELTDGYNCYNKHGYKVEPAKTIIDLQCDLDAGVGVPMPLDNETAVEVKPCEFHLVWRSLYACPICLENKRYEMHTNCVNGKKNITYEAGYACRNRTGKNNPGHRYNVPCSPGSISGFPAKSVTHTALIVFIIIFVLIAISLFVTVILLLRKNRLYRTQLFSPGTNMKRLKEDDLHELIDD